MTMENKIQTGQWGIQPCIPAPTFNGATESAGDGAAAVQACEPRPGLGSCFPEGGAGTQTGRGLGRGGGPGSLRWKKRSHQDIFKSCHGMLFSKGWRGKGASYGVRVSEGARGAAAAGAGGRRPRAAPAGLGTAPMSVPCPGRAPPGGGVRARTCMPRALPRPPAPAVSSAPELRVYVSRCPGASPEPDPHSKATS